MNPAAGPAVRDFRQGMQLQWGYLIYNAQLDKAQKHQLTTNVRLFRNGEQVFSAATNLLRPKTKRTRND